MARRNKHTTTTKTDAPAPDTDALTPAAPVEPKPEPEQLSLMEAMGVPSEPATARETPEEAGSPSPFPVTAGAEAAEQRMTLREYEAASAEEYMPVTTGEYMSFHTSPRPSDPAPEPTQAPQDEDGEYVIFLSRNPALKVNISGSVFQFEAGRLRVPAEHAAKFEGHHLYIHEHFYKASEVTITTDGIVSIRRNADRINSALDAGKAVFLFKEEPQGRLVMMAGDGFVEHRFHDGVLIVEAEAAAAVRNHRFFLEGRIKEAAPVVRGDEHIPVAQPIPEAAE